MGLNPTEFVSGKADVNRDCSSTVVEALMAARYYAGLISSFCYK